MVIEITYMMKLFFDCYVSQLVNSQRKTRKSNIMTQTNLRQKRATKGQTMHIS